MIGTTHNHATVTGSEDFNQCVASVGDPSTSSLSGFRFVSSGLKVCGGLVRQGGGRSGWEGTRRGREEREDMEGRKGTGREVRERGSDGKGKDGEEGTGVRRIDKGRDGLREVARSNCRINFLITSSSLVPRDQRPLPHPAPSSSTLAPQPTANHQGSLPPPPNPGDSTQQTPHEAPEVTTHK
ncbi:hypothetical protein E2C01_075991 [Portunus trituberculatus]|uniref:Uncharacterized protein n=1 Tax=Portunus trituberculatus TaxID=210409 RepID=A0A5B7IKV2_PORTR|nr:hypothetical protein [Portunus trituberculatus]